MWHHGENVFIFFLHRVFWTNFAEMGSWAKNKFLIISPENKKLIYNSRSWENSHLSRRNDNRDIGDTWFTELLESFIPILKNWREDPALLHFQGDPIRKGKEQLPLSPLWVELTHFTPFLAYGTDIKFLCIGHLTWLLLCYPG